MVLMGVHSMEFLRSFLRRHLEGKRQMLAVFSGYFFFMDSQES